MSFTWDAHFLPGGERRPVHGRGSTPPEHVEVAVPPEAITFASVGDAVIGVVKSVDYELDAYDFMTATCVYLRKDIGERRREARGIAMHCDVTLYVVEACLELLEEAGFVKAHQRRNAMNAALKMQAKWPYTKLENVVEAMVAGVEEHQARFPQKP